MSKDLGRRSSITRFIARGLAAALILVAPGPAAYATMARVVTPVNVNPALSPAAAGGVVNGPFMRPGGESSAKRMSASLGSILPSASFRAPIVSRDGASAAVPARIADDVKNVPAEAPAPRSEVRTPLGSEDVSASRAPPHAPSARTSVMGRLSSAVSGIPRLLGLSGSALKADAGRPFAEQASRSELAVAPSANGVGHAAGVRHATTRTPGARLAAPVSSSNGRLKTAESAAADLPARQEKAPAPKQKISRALRVGALTAVLMLAADMVVMGAATVAGYQFHPSYEMPALADPAAFAMFGDFLAPILAKAQAFFSAAWVAPLNEEIYFRAGVMGLVGFGALRFTRGAARLLGRIWPKLSSLKSWVVPAAFGIAATEAALFFTFLHEMSDPILITIRIVQALILSYLYVREGLVSGMAHHAVFNGLAILTLPLVYGAGMAVLAPQSIALGIVLAVAAFALWKATRSTARKEAADMRAGSLKPYRLSARASTRLGRAGWATVAVLAGLAFIQPTSAGTLLLGAMAAQVAPAAMGLQAYGFLMKNLERREGAAAVDAIRNPKDAFPMGNRVGAWTAGVFGAAYVGWIGALYLLAGIMAVVPGLSLPLGIAAVVAVSLLAWAGIFARRLKAGRRGIHPGLYVAQYGFGAAALSAAAAPWVVPALRRLAEWAASTGLSAGAAMPALSSSLWTIPLFIVLAAAMTLIARAVMRGRAPSAASTQRQR
ncbi:MAG: CPBP family glutamic-type intramembrane protease [Elusimicrobiota bacterium]